MKYEIKPVGYVRKKEEKYFLEIKEEYIPALKGLDGFSHVNVLWWCHLNDSEEDRDKLILGHLYKKAPREMGVFSTRAPIRPNPIALTVVSVGNIDFDDGIINISPMDAEPDTPIIDVKPYQPSLDRVRNVSVPEWCTDWPEWYEDSANFDWRSQVNF
ncbi:MAG TPA: S-adenosylmethionine-dependent methyltransferase [Thermoplasmatales archaeon]|nr:S-adenosylmethionine-dependent methyltransferase [Thermoplasmatales archaeon]